MSKSAGTEWSFILHSESALAAWGAQLAGILKIGDVIALEGNLGSGKTTLARAIIRAIYGGSHGRAESDIHTRSDL